MDNPTEIKYWAWDEQQKKPVGPYSTKEIDDLLKKGVVQNTSLVCVDGTTNWVPLRKVLRLAINIDDNKQSIGKKKYIEEIRNNSSYPTLRSVIKVVAFIFKILSFIIMVAGGILFAVFIYSIPETQRTIANYPGFMSMTKYVLGCSSIIFSFFVSGILLFILNKAVLESSLMLIDLVDSSLDNHRRQISK